MFDPTTESMMRDLLQQLRNEKPEERNELARRYAITITELEKVFAYYVMFIVNQEPVEA